MCTWNEWKAKFKIEDGYAVMMFTDRFFIDRYPLSTENEAFLQTAFADKLLDMRIFNKAAEYRLFRGDVGRKIQFREARDMDKDFYDELQYFDIDYRRSAVSFADKKLVCAAAGGYYKLPLDSFQDVQIRIRNYVDYEPDTGQAYIKDWRLVEFCKAEEVSCGK